MKRFTNHPEPWGEFVDVKSWPEIDRPGRFAGKEAFFCSVTDPYQPLEKKYRRTRALLEQLLDIRDDDQHRAPFGEPPVVCNYFYHEEITETAKKKKEK